MAAQIAVKLLKTDYESKHPRPKWSRVLFIETAVFSYRSNTLHSLHQSFNSLCISKVLVQCVQWRLHLHYTKWVLIICMLGYRCNECNKISHLIAYTYGSIGSHSRMCKPILPQACADESTLVFIKNLFDRISLSEDNTYVSRQQQWYLFLV